jgi:hypothetical protein
MYMLWIEKVIIFRMSGQFIEEFETTANTSYRRNMVTPYASHAWN